MGDALLYSGRTLVFVPGSRQLITTANGAPCCCGGTQPPPGPCGQNVTEGCPCGSCGSEQDTAFYATVTNGVRHTAWQRPILCCCNETDGPHPINTEAQTWWWQTIDGIDRLLIYQRETLSGTTTWTYTAERHYYDINTGQETAVLHYNNSFTGGPICQSRFAGFPVNDFPPIFQEVINFNPGSVNGWQRHDCENDDGDITQRGVGTQSGVIVKNRILWSQTIDPHASTCHPGCPRGACCCGGDCYSNVSATECAAMGGSYRGDGTSCAEINCRRLVGMGACCKPDGTCAEVNQTYCLNVLHGIYRGDGISCADASCPQPAVWACCLPDGHCSPLTQSACLSQGGVWHPLENCGEFDCNIPTLGACCHPDGSCSLTTSGNCDGLWNGPFTDCQTIPPCPSQGACCFLNAVGLYSCLDTTAADCATRTFGVFRGAGTTCSDPTLNCLGACCWTDQGLHNCTDTTAAGCPLISNGLGTFLGYGTTCATNPCNFFSPGGIQTPPPSKGCAGCGAGKGGLKI